MGMVHGHLLQVYPGTELVGFADPQRGAHERLASQGLRAPVFTGIPELLAAIRRDAPGAVYTISDVKSVYEGPSRNLQQRGGAGLDWMLSKRR